MMKGRNQSAATRQIQTGGLDDHDFLLLSWLRNILKPAVAVAVAVSCMEKF